MYANLTEEQLPLVAHFSLWVSAAEIHVEDDMTTLRTVTLAAALIVGATSLTMAQNGAGGTNGNNGMPPGGYKGPGAYPSYSSSDFKLPPNASNTMPPKGYEGPGGMQGYAPSNFQQGNSAANAATRGGGMPQTAQGMGGGYKPLYSYDYPNPGPTAGNTAWCESHYRSYNPATGMYRGVDRLMHACP
jgi:hypothetical protein